MFFRISPVQCPNAKNLHRRSEFQGNLVLTATCKFRRLVEMSLDGIRLALIYAFAASVARMIKASAESKARARRGGESKRRQAT